MTSTCSLTSRRPRYLLRNYVGVMSGKEGVDYEASMKIFELKLKRTCRIRGVGGEREITLRGLVRVYTFAPALLVHISIDLMWRGEVPGWRDGK